MPTPFLNVRLLQVTREGNFRTAPFRPPSLYSSGVIDISSPLHSVKPPTSTSSTADSVMEPIVARGDDVSNRLITKLWLSGGSCRTPVSDSKDIRRLLPW